MTVLLLLSCALITPDEFDARLDFDGDGHIATQFDGDDCADNDAAVHPDADEFCNGKDDDCDGYTDEDDAVDIVSWHTDADLDGYGAASIVAMACLSPEVGLVADGTDCDDAFAGANPGAIEICDEYDNDCDGETNEGDLSDVPWYRDADGDRYGGNAAALYACDAPEGYTYRGDDCDDTDGDVNPAEDEVCDSSDTDEDCDGRADDEDASASGTSNFYVDADADGYGAGPATAYCDPPAGSVNNAADCDDTDAAVTPAEGDCSIDLGSADVILLGESGGDHAGYSVSGVGDVNADGYDDLIVGAYLNDAGDTDAGASYLFLGPVTPGPKSLSEADAEYTGVSASHYAGYSVAGAGDVNGDGYADMIVGAFGEGTGGNTAGAAYVILGSSKPATTTFAVAYGTWLGEGTYEYAGWAVAGAGDVDGDGLTDLLVGAPGNDDGGTEAGAAYLVLGGGGGGSGALSSAEAQYLGEAPGDEAGKSVAAAGDYNGDGRADILVGAFGADAGEIVDSGAAYIVLGSASPASKSLSAADARFAGEQESDNAGFSVAGVGDMDADGFADVLVGAPGNDGAGADSGASYLLRGSAAAASVELAGADARWDGGVVGDRAGSSVGSAGDVDGSGALDMLVGAAQSGSALPGCVHLVLEGGQPATMSLTTAAATLVGEEAYDRASSVGSAGDIDADGLDDIIIGAPYNDRGGTDAGAAYIIFGSSL